MALIVEPAAPVDFPEIGRKHPYFVIVELPGNHNPHAPIGR